MTNPLKPIIRIESVEILPNHLFIAHIDLDMYTHSLPTMEVRRIDVSFTLNSWPAIVVQLMGPSNPKTSKTPVLFRLIDHEPIDVRM